jgi:serine/threonine-protein kinase
MCFNLRMSSGATPSQQALFEKVLGSEAFRGSGRSTKLLRFLMEHAGRSESDQLKEYSIGADALGRGPAFDPRVDSIVRVEVSRLRNRLDQYYSKEGRDDPLIIVLPKGSYVPRWEPRAADVSAPAEVVPASVSMSRVIWAVTVVGVAVLATFGTRFWVGRQGHSAAPMHLFDVRLLEDAQVGGGTIGTHVVLSPDGARVVFVGWDRNGLSRLFTRRLNEIDAAELPGTEGAQAPFFSPDGVWVGFTSTRDQKLKKVAVPGGAPIDIADATDILGATWAENNEIFARLDATPRIWRIPADGGAPKPIVMQLPPDADPRIWPQALPGGPSILVTIARRQRGFDAAEIGVVSLSDGSFKSLVHGGTFGRYLASGHLVYINQGTLYAAPFRLDRLELEALPKPVLSGVDYNRVFGFAQYDFSRTGLLAYRRSASDGPFEIAWIEPGRQERASRRPGRYSWPRIAPDGIRLAFVRQESGGSTLWVEMPRPAPDIPLAAGDSLISSPVWSPDGARVVFASGSNGLMEAPADGSSKPRLLLAHKGVVVPWSFDPAGRRLACQVRSAESAQFDLWTVPLDGAVAGKLEPFLTTPSVEVFPTFSPDGAWLAYLSNRTGAFELYVRAFPDRESREIQLTQSGAMAFRWPAKGDEIFYRTPGQRILSLRCRATGNRFECSPPRQWSDLELAESGVFPNFDITPDGRRAAALLKPNQELPVNSSQATFAIGFFDELRRRLANGPARAPDL